MCFEDDFWMREMPSKIKSAIMESKMANQVVIRHALSNICVYFDRVEFCWGSVGPPIKTISKRFKLEGED